MAAPSNNSMSALGDLYSFLFENSVNTSKKKGPNAVPDLVPSQISDGIADGIVQMGTSLGGVLSEKTTQDILGAVQKELFSTPTFSLNEKPGDWSPNKAHYANIFGTGDILPNGAKNLPFIFSGEEGQSKAYLVDNQEGINTDIDSSTVNKVLLNPAGFADKLVDDWWTARQREIWMKRIASVIDPYSGEASKRLPQIIQDFSGWAGVGSTVASTYISDVAVLGIDRDIAAAEAVVRQDAIDKKYKPDAANLAKLSLESNEVGKDGFRSSKLEEAAKTAMAMVFGITDKADREEFGTVYDAKTKAALLAKYNAMSASIPGFTPLASFEEMFTNKNRGTTLKFMKDNALFATGGPGNQVGDVMQGAFRNTFQDLSADMSLSPQLRAYFTKMSNQVNDRTSFGNLLRAMSFAYDRGPDTKKDERDGRALVKLGLAGMGQAWKEKGGINGWAQGEAYFMAEKNLKNSEKYDEFAKKRTQFANTAAYAYYRWQTMPSINKIFTPVGLLTGSSWQDLANWGGGLTGYAVGKWSPIKDTAIGSDTRAFGGYGLTRNIFTLSWKSNNFQKFAYSMQQLAPLGVVFGVLNGDYFQRAIWIGTDFGKNIGKPQSTWDAGARFGYNMLAGKTWYSKAYLTLTTGVNGLRFIANAPQFMLTYAMVAFEKARKAMQDAAKEFARKSVEKLLGKLLDKAKREAISAALGALTAGMFTLLEGIYNVLNFMTFGLLDKAFLTTMKILMQIVVGVVAGFFVWMAIGFQSPTSLIFGTGATPEMVAQYSASGGLRMPVAGWEPMTEDYDDPTKGPDPGDDTPIGYPPDTPGGGPVYSGTCQDIFNGVLSEPAFATFTLDGKRPSLELYTYSGTDKQWCNGYSRPVVRCGAPETIDWCTRCKNSAARLFRHELTHIVAPGSEFCAELIGDNGGGYAFISQEYMGSGALYLATQITAAISSKTGIPVDTIKAACLGDVTAKLQLSAKHVDLAKINLNRGKRIVNCFP